MRKRVTTNICSFALIVSFTGAIVLPVQATAAVEGKNTVVVQQAASPFQDVSPEDEAYAAIVWAKDRGIISGYADGTFKPNASITEAQFAKMLVQF